MPESSYDVAISYASEDIAIADVLAYRLRQDGFRCYYNPTRLHKLLGLEIGTALDGVYGHPDVLVVAIISASYLDRDYPMRELAAAKRKAGSKLIVVRVGNAPLPEDLKTVSYADHAAAGSERIAIQISNRIAEQIGRPEMITQLPVPLFDEPTVVALENPKFPYALENVEFCDTAQKHFIDITRNELELTSPLLYITRNGDTAPPPAPFSAVTARDILEAKRETRELIARKEATGWPIFNGRKFGVAGLKRTRTPEAERLRLIVHVYETDYVTSQFAKRLYRRLNPGRVPFDLSQDWSSYSGLLASFGFDIILFARGVSGPSLLLSRRSRNVANSETSGGLWHVSMNEGVSDSDRYAAEFDSSATLYRGFAEELNLDRVHLSRIDLFEPFLELNNFEIGISGIAYTAMNAADVKKLASRAGDSLLEIAELREIGCTASEIGNFLKESGAESTSLLRFGLQSLLLHDVTA